MTGQSACDTSAFELELRRFSEALAQTVVEVIQDSSEKEVERLLYRYYYEDSFAPRRYKRTHQLEHNSYQRFVEDHGNLIICGVKWTPENLRYKKDYQPDLVVDSFLSGFHGWYEEMDFQPAPLIKAFLKRLQNSITSGTKKDDIIQQAKQRAQLRYLQ